MRTEYEAKIQLFGISERLNLSETPTGSKQKAEWSFGISEQPQKELMPDVLTWLEPMG